MDTAYLGDSLLAPGSRHFARLILIACLVVVSFLNQTLMFSHEKRVVLQQQKVSPLNYGLLVSNATSNYAYAFLLAGVNPDSPSYRGFLFNVLISARILQTSGSKADFVVFVRMASDAHHDVLPTDETKWLQRLHCRIIYLPTSQNEGFDEAQMLKLHVLNLVDYRRVLYMDSDNMPVCNLDYLFQLSDGPSPAIRENLVVAWTGEPANGGFFILKPGQGEYEKLQAIIKEQKERDQHLPFPHFDPVQGWGHAIIAPDSWSSIRGKHGRKWDFYAAHTDQGLLYHWVKYVKKNVSIVKNMNELENWGTDENGTLVLQNKLEGLPLYDYSCFPKNATKKQLGYASHPAYGLNLRKHTPLGHVVHFYKKFKPWQTNVTTSAIETKEDAKSATQYWFHVLHELNEMLHMNIDFENWADYAASFRMAPYGDGYVASLAELRRSGGRKTDAQFVES